jgi:hypothetical protein
LDLILGGIRYADIDLKVKANQGIRVSLRRAFIGAFALGGVGLALGSLGGALMSAILHESLDLVVRFGPPLGLAAAIVGCFRFGGSAAVKHLVIRSLLAWNGDAPLRYGRFLDFACGCLLLCRVDNQFQFIHQLLLDHFAGRCAQNQHRIGDERRIPSSANSTPAESSRM